MKTKTLRVYSAEKLRAAHVTGYAETDARDNSDASEEEQMDQTED